MTGHVKDDSSAQTWPTGRCEKLPPDGGTSIPRVAAMLGDILEVIRELLTTVVKDNDAKVDQTDVKDNAVVKNGED